MSTMLLSPPKDVRFSVAQQAIVRLAKIRVQGAFVTVNVLLLLLMAYTTHRFPHKFVRIVGDCDSNWLSTDATPDAYDVVCCDAKRGGYNAPPCYTGMDLSPVLASMQGAWVLPLTALIFNYAAMILGPDATVVRVRVRVRRALLYLAVMALRSVVLYGGLNALERVVVRLVFGSASDDPAACWYAPMRRNERCSPHFDHSDHVVLLVAHYIAIPMFEWFCLNIECPLRCVKKSLLQLWLVIIAGTAVYTLFFTAAYFHTPLENLVALLVVQLGVMLPLYLLSQDRLSGTFKQLQLKYFVEPPEDAKRQ